MSVYLEKMLSAWSAEERAKINVNWDRIMATFSKLQTQINVFVGGDVEELIDQINAAITNANVTGEELRRLVVVVEGKLAEAATAITNAENATSAATTVKNELVMLKSALVTLQDELTVLKNGFSLAEDGRVAAEAQRVQNEAGRTTAETGRTTAEGERVSAELGRVQNESERLDAENARVLAENGRVAAEDLRQQKLAELLAVLDQLDFRGEYNPTSSYLPFNVVRFGRASYVALQEVMGVQPVDDGVNWRLLAAGGIDGMGAVSTVNGIQPDESGDVQLVIDFINALTSDRTDAGLSAAMGKALKALIDAHVNAMDNPHQVTAEQLALGNVQNFGVATQSEAEAGVVTDKYMNPLRTAQAISENLVPLQTALNTHLEQTIACFGDSFTRTVSDENAPTVREQYETYLFFEIVCDSLKPYYKKNNGVSGSRLEGLFKTIHSILRNDVHFKKNILNIGFNDLTDHKGVANANETIANEIQTACIYLKTRNRKYEHTPNSWLWVDNDWLGYKIGGNGKLGVSYTDDRTPVEFTFNGRYLVIFTVDNVNSGTYVVNCDGIEVFNGDIKRAKRTSASPYCLLVDCGTESTHTIKFNSPDGRCYFTGYGEYDETIEVYVNELTKRIDETYNADTVSINSLITSRITALNDVNVKVVKMNDYMPSIHTGIDMLHPDILGHMKIAENILRVIPD